MDQRQLPLIAALLCALVGAVAAGGAQAGIYQWTDAQGRVHFGDRAPGDAAVLTGHGTAPTSTDTNGLRFTLTDHGAPMSPALQQRTEESIRRMVRVYREVFRLDLRQPLVVDAHLFADQTTLRYWTRDHSGELPGNITGVYLGKQRLVGALFDPFHAEDSMQTLVHEANHVILAQMSPRAPLWLHEGLSQYFEGIALDDGHLVVHPHEGNDQLIRQMIAHKQLIQLQDYLAIPPARWQQLAHGEGNPVPYTVAWSLTSFLMSQPLKRQMLTAMLQDLEKSDIPPDLAAFVRRYPGGLTVLEYDWFKWAMQPAVTQRLD